MIGASALLSDEELAVSREATLSRWDRKSDLWLFGYGSLIWNPGLPTLEAVRGKVHGYHRGVYLWSRVKIAARRSSRGWCWRSTAAAHAPAWRSGSRAKAQFRISEVLWRREMAIASYHPAWLPCTLARSQTAAASTRSLS